MKSARTIVDVNAVPWVNCDEVMVKAGGRGTLETKFLTAPDGHKFNLLHMNGEAPPHYHSASTSFYLLKGTMDLRDRTIGPGSWVIEPRGAIHPRTTFSDIYYGLGMSDGDAGESVVPVQSIDQAPDWVARLNASVDQSAHWIDTTAAQWLPFGPGLSIKVLYVFEKRSAFASLMKAEAGAKLPRRRYFGPADLYILSGRAKFGDAVASEGCWVHEPAGADEDVVRFPVETEFVANCYGSIVEFGDDGGVLRVIDGFSLRDLAHIRTGGATKDADLQQSLDGMNKTSSPRSALATTP